jgi:integrase
VSEGLLDTNPVQGTAKLDEGASRERVLTRAELVAIWQAVPKNQFGDIVRLLLLTGQRREEIGGLRWSEIDFDRGLIVFPAARTKNRREHSLPLSRQATAILRAQPHRKDRDLIFGYGKGGFSGWSDCKSSLDEALQSQRKRKAMPEWRLHDLRRTAATMMMELGTAPHVVEAVLNHVSGSRAGIAGIYNRAKLVEPMREALQKWADYVEEISRSR